MADDQNPLILFALELLNFLHELTRRNQQTIGQVHRVIFSEVPYIQKQNGFVFGQKPACTLNIDLHGKHWIPLWQLPGEPYVPGGLTNEGWNGAVTVRDQQRRNHHETVAM